MRRSSAASRASSARSRGRRAPATWTPHAPPSRPSRRSWAGLPSASARLLSHLGIVGRLDVAGFGLHLFTRYARLGIALWIAALAALGGPVGARGAALGAGAAVLRLPLPYLVLSLVFLHRNPFVAVSS